MLAGAVNWLFTIIISLVTKPLSKLNDWMFYIFGIFNFLGGLFIIFFLVESKGKSKTRIQDEYRGNAGTKSLFTSETGYSKFTEEAGGDHSPKLLDDH